MPPAVFGHEFAGVISEVANGRGGSPLPAARPDAKDGAHDLSAMARRRRK